MSGKRKKLPPFPSDHSASIVCDIGSGVIKAGLVQDMTYPRVVFPCFSKKNSTQNQNLVGKEVESIFESVFSTLSPIPKGDDANILSPSNKQNIRTEGIGRERGVVITENVEEISSRNRKRKEVICEMVFEKFNFDFLNISPSAALCLAARGTTTGLVVDCGHAKTEIVPVCNGFVQKGNVRRLEMGGSTVTRRFIDLSKRSDSRNFFLDPDGDFFEINSAKEKLCYVALNLAEERYVAEKTNLLNRQFFLPDKTAIFVNTERFLAPEILFQPKFSGDVCSDSFGITDLISDSINSSAIDSRASLFRSIILAGGTTLLQNFSQRISQDLSSTNNTLNVYVDACPERMFLGFRGGCVMAAMDNPDWWVTKSEFEEKGCCAIFKL